MSTKIVKKIHKMTAPTCENGLYFGNKLVKKIYKISYKVTCLCVQTYGRKSRQEAFQGRQRVPHAGLVF